MQRISEKMQRIHCCLVIESVFVIIWSPYAAEVIKGIRLGPPNGGYYPSSPSYSASSGGDYLQCHA